MNTEQTVPAVSTPAPTVGAGAGNGAAKAKAAVRKPSKPKVTKAAAPKAKMPKTSKKLPAKKAKAKAITGDRLVPADLATYHIDKDKKTAGGHPSVDCADDVATMLRGKALDAVYALVAKKIGEPEKDLRAKYKQLNVGMQRMNLGNRLRGVLNAK